MSVVPHREACRWQGDYPTGTGRTPVLASLASLDGKKGLNVKTKSLKKNTRFLRCLLCPPKRAAQGRLPYGTDRTPVLAFACIPRWEERAECKNQIFKEKTPDFSGVCCAPREIRTPVLALKGLRPGPLDDGGIREKFYHNLINCKGKVKIGT